MRSSIVALLVALTLACVASVQPAAARGPIAFKKTFEGGYVRCESYTLQGATYGEHASKKGKVGTFFADVVDLAGAKYRYTFSATVGGAAHVNVPEKHRRADFPAWEYTCKIFTDEDAEYTCPSVPKSIPKNINHMSGRCVGCKGGQCRSVFVRANRTKRQ